MGGVYRKKAERKLGIVKPNTEGISSDEKKKLLADYDALKASKVKEVKAEQAKMRLNRR